MNDDIIKKIANLINEDEPSSIFHASDEFGDVPDTESQLMSQLFMDGWDFTQPAEAAITILKTIVDRYGLSDDLANAVAHDIMVNYSQYQKHGYPLPEGPSQPSL